MEKTTLAKATKQFESLKLLDDGKIYAIALDPWVNGSKKYYVREKTQQEIDADNFDTTLANTKITDFVKNYDTTKDLH